jgi:hypothetical protein
VDDDSRDRQAFYAGVPKPRELKHDAELYRAYTEEAERLRDEGANIHRIVLENDLKREYQEFLQERNRDRDDSDGRSDRDPSEIQDWARERDLPCDDQGHVQFPDVRIEYDIDGRDRTLDVEVMTPHYRGAHAAAKSGSGFRLYFTARSGGGRGGGRTPSIVEELLRWVLRAAPVAPNTVTQRRPRREVLSRPRCWFHATCFERWAMSGNCGGTTIRSVHARSAFSAPRLKALYKVWKQDGEPALTGAGSRAMSDAVEAGAGRVEVLELGHRYGHLSPLATVA